MVHSGADTDTDTYTDTYTDNDTDTENDEEERLNTQWIEQFKREEDDYNDFYKEPVTSIKVFFLYVNKTNELEHIYSDLCLLIDNRAIKRETIISLIKHNQYFHSIKYKLLSILKYNIDLEPNEVTNYIYETTSRETETPSSMFFTAEKYLNDIYFADSINMFQDLNALFFIFCEPCPPTTTTSTSEARAKTQTQTQTKKVYLSTVTRQRQTKKYKGHNDNLKKNLKINKAIQ
jgi:hypothetical protein